MTINWDTGDINSEQYRVSPEHVFVTAEMLPTNQDSYIEVNSLGISLDGRMWVDAEAVLVPRHEVAELHEAMPLCRIIKLEAGIVVDLSRSTFDLTEGGPTRFVPNGEIQQKSSEWLPVIDVVHDDEERERLERILFSKEIFIGNTLLSEL